MSGVRHPFQFDPSQARAANNTSKEVPTEGGTLNPPAVAPSNSYSGNAKGREMDRETTALTGISFEGLKAVAVTFNFNDTRSNSPGTNIWGPSISSNQGPPSSAPAEATNSPIGTSKKSDQKWPGSQLRSMSNAEASSSSSEMGFINRRDEPPRRDAFISKPEQVQNLNKLLKSSIPEPKVVSASLPGRGVDSGLGMTPSNSRQVHNSNFGPLVGNSNPPFDQFTGSGPMRMRIPTGPANHGHFVNHQPGRDGAPQFKNVTRHPQPQPPPTVVELLALPIVPRLDVQGPIMHARTQAFDTQVLVLIPVPVLRNRVECELFEVGGHVLKVNFLWKIQDGRDTLVRVGQENWHRVLNSVKGADFRWFAQIWQANVRRQPDGVPFFEECRICKAEDAERNPGSAANQLQVVFPVSVRPFNFKHILRNQPYPGGRGLEINA